MQETAFRTTDTGLATWLISQGYSLLRVDYARPRYEYAFTDSPELREASNQYLIGNALVDPAALLRVNKKLLRIIKNQRQWEED